MFLVHTVGMTAFNPTFTVDFCLLAMGSFGNCMWGISKLADNAG